MIRTLMGALFSFAFLGGYLARQSSAKPEQSLQLGNFSVSLTVKDIAKSREFYEKLGFHVKSGDQSKKWLVLQNETATIGLFQGFIDKNSLLFNPGWDRSGKGLATFDDIRDIQRVLKSRGIAFTTTVDEATTGPGSFSLTDPDGNPILVDQYVPSPRK